MEDEPSPSQETSTTASAKASWNAAEVTAFIDYLHEHRAERGDTGNFKLSTYNLAALAIAFHRTVGPAKTGLMCKTKWTVMKRIYNAIETYRNRSGFHWDHDRGANIEGEAAEAVWNEYISRKVCSIMT
ncbi:hypothetical protein BU15DRAFT_50176 [Melanogaster broomeanus]|nr:hypothetical protein BU15DRAFT_50176 [Melanogaster broomeanus]